jgi:hypothetical protein
MSNDQTKIFVVYHKIIDEDVIFARYPKEYLKNTFIYYCVNEIIEKQYTPTKYNIETIKEFELPYYNPYLQLRSYMETSAYIHIYKNGLHKELDFIGICQYDMIHGKEYKNLDKNTIYILSANEPITYNGIWNEKMYPKIRNLDFLLNSYNAHFKKQYTIKDLHNLPLSLWQTNIYPKRIFEKLCAWLIPLIDAVYPWSVEPPYETHWGVMGGYTERAIAIFNAIEILETGKYETLAIFHTEMCNKIQYNKNHTLNYYDSNVYTKFIHDITTIKIDDLHYSMFKATCYKGTEIHNCERVCIKNKNGLLFQKKDMNIVYGFEIEAEDPRMVILKDKIYVVFICLSPYEGQNRCIAITEYDNFEPTFLRVENMKMNSIEKNWAPFEKDGELHFVYSYDPLIILKYDFNKNGICNVIYKQNNIDLPIHTENIYLRGGSNLIHYREKYYMGGCHSRWSDGIRFYHFTHMVLLDVEKWKIVYVSKPVMYNYNKNDMVCVNGTNILLDIHPNCIQDPVSIYIRENKYYITVNIRDSITHLYELQMDIPDGCLKNYEMFELQEFTEKYVSGLFNSLEK